MVPSWFVSNITKPYVLAPVPAFSTRVDVLPALVERPEPTAKMP